ncbi:MAG: putative metal-binding motif-containing protein, partial [Deltaproteobacteria bacterium]
MKTKILKIWSLALVLGFSVFISLAGCGDEGGGGPSCIDNDGDGYGEHCSLGADCNDSDANINPGAAELDNGVDDDCDGDNLELGLFDGDGDGYTDNYGSASDPTPDCNDGDATSYPGATEVCDDDLETCGGVADDGCNGDGDNYCTPAMAVVGSPTICPSEAGGTYPGTAGTDCNDGDPTSYPGATEVCDDDLETCGVVADEGCDDDNDDWCDLSMTTVGTPTVCPNGGSDCNDNDITSYPGAT